MIERLEKPNAWSHPGPPIILSKERAVLPCGCAVYIGLRIDTQETAMAVTPCSPEHIDQMARFLEEFRASLVDDPQARPAVEVADEMLAAMA